MQRRALSQRRARSLRSVALSVLAALLVGALASHAPAQLEFEVNEALNRASARLLEAQQADGSFGPLEINTGLQTTYPMGTTALAVYALLKSGVPPRSVGIERAVNWLLEQPFRKTYSVAALVLAFDAHGAPRLKPRLLEAAAWLEDNVDENRKLWAYPEHDAELSNTQFAVLALKAAARHGYESSPALWNDVIDGALSRQNQDGGFYYRFNHLPESSGTMTTAGITTLHVALEFLQQSGREDSAPARLAREGIEQGWTWLDARFSPSGSAFGREGAISLRYPENGTGGHGHYYFLYGVERVAAFAERKLVGGRPWYRHTALEILGHESPEGGWSNLENTCFAMLVLQRATLSGGRRSEPESEPDAPTAAELAAPDEREDLLVESDELPVMWAYSSEEPPKAWLKPKFDDSEWPRGAGGFGTPDVGGLEVRTNWPVTDELWIRRLFDWDPGDAALQLYLINDDSATVWINGKVVAESATWSGRKYVGFQVPDAVQRGLRPTGNVVAAKAHNSGGAASLDVRFSPAPKPPNLGEHWQNSAPRLDVPFIRRWNLFGPLLDKTHEALLSSELPDALDQDGESRNGQLKRRAWESRRTLFDRLTLPPTGERERSSITYASVWLHVEEAFDGYLWLSTTSGFRAWVDGELLTLHHEHAVPQPDDLRVPLQLDAGAHQLVLAVEQRTGPTDLFARVSSRSGRRVHGLRYALNGEARDDPAVAVAQPGLFEFTELLATLPLVASSKLGPLLSFDKQDGLEFLAIDGNNQHQAPWIDRPDSKAAGLQPPSNARGVLALLPRSGLRPARVMLRAKLPERLGALRVSAAVDTLGASGAQLRVGLFDGALSWLESFELKPDTGKRAKTEFHEFAAPADRFAGREVILIVEVSAFAGARPEPVFLDEISLR